MSLITRIQEQDGKYLTWISTIGLNTTMVELPDYPTEEQAVEIRAKYLLENNLEDPDGNTNK